MKATMTIGLLMLTCVAAFGDEIEARRVQREREHKRQMLASLSKVIPAEKVPFQNAASAPQRSADIERYLKKSEKITAEVHSLALLVNTHDVELTPIRVYRVRYARKDGSKYTADFLLQQEGAAHWKGIAHVPVDDGFGS
jgi:hypothetical protein